MPKALIVEILADAKQFGAELDRAAGKTRRMGAVAGVAGLAIAGGLAVGLEKSVEAAGKAQQATSRMDAAFTASGQSASKFAGQIDQAETSGRNLGFSNIDIRDSLGTLEVATKSGSKAISDLSEAEDIARFKHIDLASASKVLTMTMAGSTRAAHMLGIQTQSVTTAEDKVKAAFHKHSGAAYDAALATAKLTDKQSTAASVIDLVKQKLGGQAAAYADTAQGGMAKFHAEGEAIEENLGSGLLPILGKVASGVASLTGFLAKHTTVAKVATVAIGLLSGALILASLRTKLVTAATELWTIATKAATAGQWLLNAALSANPIALVIVGLVALGAALVVAWEKSATFRRVVTGVWDDVKSATRSFVSFFIEKVPGAVTKVKNAITDGLGDAKHWVSRHWPEIATIISGPFAPLVALATGAFGIRGKLSAAWTAIKNDAVSGFKALGSALGNVLKAPVNLIIEMLDALDFGVHYSGLKVFGHTVIPSVNFDWHPFHIPALAAGGVVTKPTVALLGEAGPEAVIPLSNGSSATGVHGGGDLHFHFHGPVFGNKRDVARELAQDVRQELVRIGMRETTIFSRPGVTP